MRESLERGQPAVLVKNLTRKFGRGLLAVDNLDLEIKKGEIFALLGPNGAGKTTTIKMLSCLLRPTSGTAEVSGRDIIKNPREVKKIINVSPQETAVSLNLNARENLFLMGKVYGLSDRLAKEQAERFLEAMDLKERAVEAVKKYSGGMLRRLNLAMALVSDPEVLFLDEPTIGLDAKSRKSLWKLIDSYRGKKTILLTTHYLEEADALSDRIGIIDKGKLVALGTSEELKRKLAGLQTMKIRGENFNSELIQILREIYPEIIPFEGGLVIKGEEIIFDEVVDLLRSKGVKIKWLSMEEPSLDEIYLKITGGGKRDEIA